MERIDIRVHDEISNVAERYYGFTIRQWLFGFIVAIVTVPTWFLLQPILGDDTTGWIVVVEAVPIVFIGFIPVQEMSAEKIIPYWIRHYLKFAKPLEYKTDKQLLEEKLAKKQKRKKKKVSDKKEIKVSEPIKKEKISRKEKKRQAREEKRKRQELKKQRREQRELAKAKKKYESDKTYEFDENILDHADIQSIIRLGKLLEEKEAQNNNVKEETGESIKKNAETKENRE